MARIARDYPDAVRETTRHGREVWYHRVGKGPRTRLPDDVDSEAFQRAYEAAKAGKPVPGAKPRPRVAKAQTGSFRAAWEAYQKSPAFLAYDAETRKARARLMEAMCREPMKRGGQDLLADCPMERVTSVHVTALRDRCSATPEQGNHRLKTLRKFCRWANKEGLAPIDASAGVEKLGGKSGGGHHVWTPEEAVQYLDRHPLGTRAAVCFGLLAFAGLRISDAAQIGPSHRRGGWIFKPQHKGRGKRRTVIELPVLPILDAILTAGPLGELTFLATEYGRPFSIKGLGNRFRKWCDDAGLNHCSAHGLRHAGATMGAENGATEHQLMAIFNWMSPKMAATYTRQARRKALAESGMGLIVSEQIAAKIPHLLRGMAEGAGKNDENDNEIKADRTA